MSAVFVQRVLSFYSRLSLRRGFRCKRAYRFIMRIFASPKIPWIVWLPLPNVKAVANGCRQFLSCFERAIHTYLCSDRKQFRRGAASSFVQQVGFVVERFISIIMQNCCRTRIPWTFRFVPGASIELRTSPITRLRVNSTAVTPINNDPFFGTIMGDHS